MLNFFKSLKAFLKLCSYGFNIKYDLDKSSQIERYFFYWNNRPLAEFPGINHVKAYSETVQDGKHYKLSGDMK
jgi:hypothetical protein